MHCSCPLYLSLSGPLFCHFCKSGASRTLAAMANQANMPMGVIDRVNLAAAAWPDQTASAGCAIQCIEAIFIPGSPMQRNRHDPRHFLADRE
ncbi:hypothetical protein OU5_4929 [Pseudomonas mandelii JR-1]|uniref:Uncharacterized protein n=1 Tax=Pseudomonas mandelii JR-1 TaxID=1147786 RepID=A0A024EI36_9PSED|nr:hypothetical protein OU5_4929 [Pseudomonas mandelii JR-1]